MGGSSSPIPPEHLSALERVLASRTEEPNDAFRAVEAAGRLGDLDLMRRVLEIHPSIERHELASRLASYGHAPGSVGCVEWLLDNGVNVRAVDPRGNGWCLAHSCALAGT